MRYLLQIPLLLEGEGAAWGFHIHWYLFSLIGFFIWFVMTHEGSKMAWIGYFIWILALPLNDNRIWIATLFPETWATVFIVLAFGLIVIGQKQKEASWFFIAAGVVMGLAVWTRNNLEAISKPFAPKFRLVRRGEFV